MTLKFNKDGYPYEDLIEENKKLESRIEVLNNSLSIALEINDNYQIDNKKDVFTLLKVAEHEASKFYSEKQKQQESLAKVKRG